VAYESLSWEEAQPRFGATLEHVRRLETLEARPRKAPDESK
jgi:hypothetical protein